MRLLDSQYFKPALLFAFAIPLLLYDFSSVNWIVTVRPVDLTQPAVFTDSFRVPRDGPYVVEFGINGHADDCAWGVTGAACENAHRQFDVDWKVTEEGRVILDGRSSAGFRGTWSTAQGSTGVTLGSFDGIAGKRYALSLDVRSPAPALTTHTPRVTVEAGQPQRDRDLLEHAAAFVAAMALIIGSFFVAMRSARQRVEAAGP